MLLLAVALRKAVKRVEIQAAAEKDPHGTRRSHRQAAKQTIKELKANQEPELANPKLQPKEINQ